MLAAVKGRPGDETGVFSLQEERLGLAVLEPEDLAVATDVDLTLQIKTHQHPDPMSNCPRPSAVALSGSIILITTGDAAPRSPTSLNPQFFDIACMAGNIRLSRTFPG